MQNGAYVSRRREASMTGARYFRNRNMIYHQGQTLGTMSFSVLMGLLVLVVGLIYVTQGTQGTSYDYELSDLTRQVEDLEAQKEDLAVEQARLTAVKTMGSSKVAMAMEQAKATQVLNN